jgi:hypothetical protein
MSKPTTATTLPGTESWFAFFGTCYMIVLFLMPTISVIVLSGFLSNLPGSLGNPISKLTFFLFLVYTSMGFWVFFTKMYEYWEESFVIFQRGKYNAKTSQKPITLELHIPQNYQYNPKTLIGFFFFMGNAFKTTNVTKQVQYNYGRWYSSIAFDFIAHKGEIKAYVTFPRKKYNETIEMFKRFFPEVGLEVVDDPYKEWPKKWEEGVGADGFKHFVGFHLGNSGSNVLPTVWVGDTSITNMPMDMMLRAARDIFPDQKIILQQVFRFNPNNHVGSKPAAQAEFAKMRQELFEKYAPKKSDGGMDSHAFEALMPHSISKAIDTVATHLEIAYPAYSYRVMALCTDERQANLVIQKLEKLARVYEGNLGDFFLSNSVDIKYITSTDQEYSTGNSIHPNFKPIYDTYYYPKNFGPQGEAFISPMYEKYYYPNENRYRCMVNYSRMKARDINAPWNGDWNITEALSMAGFWQLPSMSRSTAQIEIVQGGSNLDTYKDIYENN